MATEDREDLKATLAERNASIPAHSIRPHQLIEIEELEEEIDALEKRLESGRPHDEGRGGVT